ncbi:MAG: hypothetical protein HYZ54_07340 [Ignavibacteriae bacterium]|nr:hypothetical protein [Ignavibacteriota bacterium]
MEPIVNKQVVSVFQRQLYIPSRKVIGIFLIWTAIHFSLLAFGHSWFHYKRNFYPIVIYTFPIFDFVHYDYTEFIYYVIFPMISILVSLNIPIELQNRLFTKTTLKTTSLFAFATWFILNVFYLSIGIFYKCGAIFFFFTIIPILLSYSIKLLSFSKIIDSNNTVKKSTYIISILILSFFILMLSIDLNRKVKDIGFQEEETEEVQNDLYDTKYDNKILEKTVEEKDYEINKLESENRRLKAEVEELSEFIEELRNNR